MRIANLAMIELDESKSNFSLENESWYLMVVSGPVVGEMDELALVL